MTIALGNDHGGFELKEALIGHLKDKGCDIRDFGGYDACASDYPDSAVPVCEAVLSGEADLGILICGTGIGISISANKLRGIRCALCGDVFSARMARLHNNAQVLALGGRVVGVGHAFEIVDAFIGTAFSGEERHARRVGKIMKLENR